VQKLRTRVPTTKKITINLGYVGSRPLSTFLVLKRILFPIASDFIPHAIRNQLDTQVDWDHQIDIERHTMETGMRDYYTPDLEARPLPGEIFLCMSKSSGSPGRFRRNNRVAIGTIGSITGVRVLCRRAVKVKKGACRPHQNKSRTHSQGPQS